MSKIKKIYKYTLVILITLFILTGAGFLTLRSPKMQSWLFNRLSSKISDKIQGKISSTSIQYTFFNKIRVTDLLILDNTSDTLLYAPFLEAGIKKIKRKERFIKLGRISIEDPVIGIRADTTGEINLLYFIDLIIPEDTARRNKDLIIRQMRIYNARLKYSSGARSNTNTRLDLNNLLLHNLNLTIDNFDKHYDKFSLVLSDFSCKTKEGFEITDMFAELDIHSGHFYLLDPTIRTTNSFINSDIIGLDMKRNGSNFNFYRDASFNLKLNSSLISLADLAYFIEPLSGYKDNFVLSADINGTIQEINGRNVSVFYSDSTQLLCDFDLSGLPDIDNTFMFIDIENFTTSTTEIASLNIPGIDTVNIGKELMRLGNLSFKGNFTGFTTDFVTYGIINTELGSVSTDILFKPDTTNTFVYNGTLKARSINLGELLNEKDLFGVISAHVAVKGTSESFKKFRAELDVRIDSLEFNGFSYKDIMIGGRFTEKIWDGKISSNTKELKMDLLGRFDFNGTIPEVDFSLNLLEADMYAMNIDPDDSLSSLSMLLTASFKGDDINNVSGDIKLLNSKLKKFGNDFDLYDCSLNVFDIDSIRYGVNFRSDYLDVDINGIYNLSMIINDLKIAGSYILPSVFKAPKRKISSLNEFDYEIRFKNTDKLNKFFKTQMMLSPGSVIHGIVKPGETITVLAEGDYVTYKNNSLTDFRLNCGVKDTLMDFHLNSNKLSLANRINFESFQISSSAVIDKADFRLSWNNKGDLENKGAFTTKAVFSRPNSTHTKLDVAILPSEIVLNNQKWDILQSEFIIDSNAITVNRLRIEHASDFLMLDGKISENSDDNLNISFNNLKLAALNNIKKERLNESEKRIEFFIEGLMSGNILLTDLYNKPVVESDIKVSDFVTNDHSHGNVLILSEWNNNEKVAKINVNNNINKGQQTFSINGSYSPESKNMDIMVELDKMPLDILNIFLSSFASDVDGMGTGKVRISNENGIPFLNGSMMAHNTSMTIDYLQSNFMFSDSIRFRDNKIIFESIELSDKKNNHAVINGFIANSNFNDWDVDLRIDANNIQVFDTRQKDNNMFYGTAYSTGVFRITGPAKQLDMNISAKTDRNTQIFIPLSSGKEINDYTFISFIGRDEEKEKNQTISLPVFETREKGALSLNFELDVRPDAEIQLVFDSKLGDVMKARGRGMLNMAISREGEFSIFGDYIIEEGDYQLSMGNIFNKRFMVENGGKISWNGDIMSAEIDIKAIYKTKASLYDLFHDDAYTSRIPVECQLNMTGQLSNPLIGFDIYLPTADENTRTYLRNTINTEEDMSRQFLYLLVMNSFYPDPSFSGSSANTVTTGASAMGVITTEMLSNQLSNWVSQISNDFDIGFLYRPGNEISSQEVEFALSTQLLNDRVVINSNFDVGRQETTSSTNNISGDFDVEVKITEKIRFKVFNRSNDNLMFETAPYTQGFGLFFRKSFDKFRDLFKRKNKEIKMEEETEIVEE